MNPNVRIDYDMGREDIVVRAYASVGYGLEKRGFWCRYRGRKICSPQRGNFERVLFFPLKVCIRNNRELI